MGWILNWGGQEGGINGLRNMVSTAGIHTQGARKMPWQDLRTAREGGNGFDLRFGACAVAVSLGVGRLWPRNPLTGSACSVAFLRVLRLGSLRALGWLSGVQNTQNFFSAIAKVRIGLVFQREVQSCRFLCLRLILARGCYVRASLLCEGRASPSSGLLNPLPNGLNALAVLKSRHGVFGGVLLRPAKRVAALARRSPNGAPFFFLTPGSFRS